ncbi:hypothetical protein XMM379_002248 [Aliiroseovarius sp. xm-m-379]|nr:hypothetical protein [Aliiroseovarius sp. xm-d-517]NRP25550.1 hypothetical protein [Aliiroseovarius sp. xm-m-379]NRP29543.1 hypothetical protein [Aliiroseovarius sp. xm-m-314]NRP34349.1 hypothetical protein [Aliiroseovarius sp. xm-a-104]NRP41692.1 hypothetical protein [Aliiroseovarius sp. xm-m-339-2]NRP44281.1 hypothetical protein [Aliiroseovarius sp. xm-m-378]NRP48343.1 hypothetical protein [Aliiroseovarius sp. xm-m-354]NRP62698.1 hypothetical protein [Aliiroseovarius sp. xm-a-151]NRP65
MGQFPLFALDLLPRVAQGIDLIGAARQAEHMNIQNSNPNAPGGLPPEQVVFDRRELGVIMGLYGRMVAAGEWRDYAMSFLRDLAVFSVFRRSAEHPLYRIEKRPRLRMRQGQYSVLGMDGRVLKRGDDLRQVLRVLERKLIRVVE